MEIKDGKSKDVVIVEAGGALDTLVSDEFSGRITKWIDAGERKILIDLSGLTYISSSGLRAFLIAAKKLAKTGGTMRLAGLRKEIQDVFDISGFTSLFSIFPTQQEALQNF